MADHDKPCATGRRWHGREWVGDDLWTTRGWSYGIGLGNGISPTFGQAY
jgi:hypothetical protein